MQQSTQSNGGPLGSHNARRAQEQTLSELLNLARRSPLGRSRGLEGVETHAGFRQRMPLVTDIELRVHPERCWLGVPEADSAAAGRRWKAASRILCPLVGKIELQSDWLDLRDQLPAADAERTKPFHQRLQAMLNRMSGNAAKVIVAPTQWLCAVLGQLRARGSSGTEPGSLDQVFPELRAVIAIASGFDGLLPLLHLQLSETDRDLVVLGGYEAVPRGLVGIQGHPADERYVFLPDAGYFMEFLSRGGESRLPLWELSKGQIYELCVSSSHGPVAYRTNRRLLCATTEPYRFVPCLSPARSAAAPPCPTGRSDRERGRLIQLDNSPHWSPKDRFEC